MAYRGHVNVGVKIDNLEKLFKGEDWSVCIQDVWIQHQGKNRKDDNNKKESHKERLVGWDERGARNSCC